MSGPRLARCARNTALLWHFLSAGSLVACSDEAGGDGAVSVHASGEAAAEVGYPTAPGSPENIAFVDGYTLQLARVVVSAGDFALETSGGDSADVVDDAVVFDLHRGMPALWTFEGIGARRWDRVSYRVLPLAAGSTPRNVNGVDDDAIARMKANGWSILIEGTAQKGSANYTFSFGFALQVHASACHNGTDETDGIVVAPNGVTEAEMTFHLDHLFHDSFTRAEPALRFEPFAGSAGADHHITLATLATQPLADLRGADGAPIVDDEGNPVLYDPGTASLPARTLAEFVIAEAVTLGHFNGEGHCDYTRE